MQAMAVTHRIQAQRLITPTLLRHSGYRHPHRNHPSAQLPAQQSPGRRSSRSPEKGPRRIYQLGYDTTER